MYLAKLIIENFRCFSEGDDRFELFLKRGLTALVGENEAGKSAVIDALRFALGTTDQEWNRLEDSDFRPGEKPSQFKEIKIVCKFDGLEAGDKRAFVEYLTYGEKPEDDPVLYINWTAKDTGEKRRGQPFRRIDLRSGKDGDGPAFAEEARVLLRGTYLRPLRDAEEALSSGRGSRLAQVLNHTSQIKAGGVRYDPNVEIDPKQLNVLGIGDLANALLEGQQGIVDTRNKIDTNLKELSLLGNSLKSSIKVSGAIASDEIRLRQLLEKLDLKIHGEGKLGLGTDNLLFMACELLLLAQEDEGNKLLLIEEPEAHLHPQRQLRVMNSLQQQAKDEGIQIIVTTHSPNLASAIELDNIVMIHNRRGFSLAQGNTQLDRTDYRFLKRFLDVTKANLFFARGVIVVEGDAENILLPTLAEILGRDFTKHGVSVVNVGGVGLRRYAKIFQRKDEEQDCVLEIPVACVTDLDVMPDCAPVIIGKVEKGVDWPAPANRRWLAKKDFKDEIALAAHRDEKIAKAAGQRVQTFVSDQWTLEYDLAYSGLAEDVYVAAELAKKEDALNGASLKTIAKAVRQAQQDFQTLAEESEKAVAENKASGCTQKEVLAAKVYAQFTKGTKASKAIAAQYLAERLQRKHRKGKLTADNLRTLLPKYLTKAIDYVTSSEEIAEAEPNEEVIADE